MANSSRKSGLTGQWLLVAGMLGVLTSSVARGEADAVTAGSADFVYPVEWLKSGPAKQRMEYSSLRNQMLQAGFNTANSTGLQLARRHYEAAHMICADDPRLDYGLGLVLWTRGERASAVDKFEMPLQV